MDESVAELASLQQLLDRSFAVSSEHLRSIMTPERRLDADRLVQSTVGACVLNLGTVTAGGEPRVSAVDGHFRHGRWYFTTSASSPKARQLAARPAVSAAYTPRDGFGVFCHGRARSLERATAEFDDLVDYWTDYYGAAPDSLAPEIAYLCVDASWLVGFEMTADEMAAIEADAAARAARA